MECQTTRPDPDRPLAPNLEVWICIWICEPNTKSIEVNLSSHGYTGTNYKINRGFVFKSVASTLCELKTKLGLRVRSVASRDQIKNQSRLIRLRMVIRELNTKSIQASCSKALLHFVNFNLDCVFEAWLRVWIPNTKSIEASCSKALLHFVN